jgi:hypothetical protein
MKRDAPSKDELVAVVEARIPGGTPLERLTAAVSLADELNGLGDELMDHFVATAREAGCSWSEIGGKLGVSKQAAQKRFVAPPRGAGPFERFSPRARRVLDAAQQEALQLRHGYLGTEHLLLGLLAVSDGPAAEILHRLEVSAEAVRGGVERIIGAGSDSVVPPLALSRRTKKVLELSRREARALGHSHIGTEHLLLALVREGEGVAAQILTELGASAARVRQEVRDQLDVSVPDRLGRSRGRRRRLRVGSRNG